MFCLFKFVTGDTGCGYRSPVQHSWNDLASFLAQRQQQRSRWCRDGRRSWKDPAKVSCSLYFYFNCRQHAHLLIFRAKLYVLSRCEPVLTFVKKADYQFYQNLVEVLIPDVLRPIPADLTLDIRNFGRNLENWLLSAMSGCPEDVVVVKVRKNGFLSIRISLLNMDDFTL